MNIKPVHMGVLIELYHKDYPELMAKNITTNKMEVQTQLWLQAFETSA